MKREVKSSVIKTVNHIQGMSALKVEFHNGTNYLYHPVLKHEFDNFMAAESKGKYLNEHFKGKGKRVWR